MAWDPLGLFEALDDSVAVYDPDGTVVYANAVTERLLGRGLVGKRLWDVVPNAVGDDFYAAFEQVSLTGQGTSLDHYYAPWDRWFRSQIRKLDGRVYVVATDITEQKLAEQRVQALSLASRAFSRALEPEQLYRELAFALSDTIGDACIVALIDGDQLRAAAVDHSDPAALAAYRELVARPVKYTEGASGRVFVTGQPILMPAIDTRQIRETYLDASRRAQIDATGAHSLIAVPFREGERRVGSITLLRDHTRRAYTARDLTLVEDLAERASMAITHVRLYDEAERARRRASALASASRAFSIGERDTRRILELLAEATLNELGDCVVASLVSPDGQSVEPVIAIADFEIASEVRTLLTAKAPIAGSYSERVIDTREPIFTPHVDRAQFAARARPKLASIVERFAPQSFIMVPIESGGQALGTLSAARVHSSVPYTREDLTLLIDLAGRASLAIENARVLEAERAARRDAEQIAEQTRHLQLITSRLSDRRPVKQIAEIVLHDSVGVLRAATAAIWLVDPSGNQVEMLASAGYPDPLRFNVVPLDVPSPMSESIRTGAPVYIASRAEYLARFPRSTECLGDAELAAAAIPLVSEGRAIGGLVISFTTSHAFFDKERAFLEVLANQTAQAIDRTRADEKARAADRRKDEFLAMLGHELRNPLAPILTALQLMDLRGETAAVRERQIIARQTRHLGLLVDDLLDVSRIARGTLELRRTRVDLRPIISHAVEVAGPLLDKRNHTLALDLPTTALVVDGDELRLDQIIQNLVTNAAKYTAPAGMIRVRATARDGAALVEVEDNGDGIAPELMAVMFEPFVQGTRSFDRSQGGLGVGLALVKSLVDLHGGTVTAHSDGAGTGSRFTITLPLAIDHAAASPPIAFVDRASRGTSRRILLVDDNTDAAEMLADVLRDAGHEVLVAHDGPSALDAAPRFTPDVALLDIGLPVMDGYDLARRLRATLASPPRFVALTGYGQEHDRRRSSEAGFDEHLVKPVDTATVLAAIIAAQAAGT